MSKNTKTVPVFDLNVPNGGMQKKINIPSDAPVYSSYTGEKVGNGPLAKGTICDAPPSHPNHGKPFHVIEHNPVNNTWMAHFANTKSSTITSFSQGSSRGYSRGGGMSYSVGGCSNINIY